MRMTFGRLLRRGQMKYGVRQRSSGFWSPSLGQPLHEALPFDSLINSQIPRDRELLENYYPDG